MQIRILGPLEATLDGLASPRWCVARGSSGFAPSRPTPGSAPRPRSLISASMPRRPPRTRRTSTSPRPTRALIGRRAERQWLVDRLADAQQERAHVVLLRGEAGVGKSRLARELEEAHARGSRPPSAGSASRPACRTTPSPATDDGSRRSADTLEGDDVTPGDPTGGCVTRSIID
jgi:hypothetical protein